MGYHAFQGFKFDLSTANTMKCYPRKIATGDDFILYSNLTDSYPFLQLSGNAGMIFDVPAGYSYSYRWAGNLYSMLKGENAGGQLFLKECTTPTAVTNYGTLYTKNDNKLYFQDGAGNEHEVSFAP